LTGYRELEDPAAGPSTQVRDQAAPPVEAVTIDIPTADVTDTSRPGKRKLVYSESEAETVPVRPAIGKGKGRAQDPIGKRPANGTGTPSETAPAVESLRPRPDSDGAVVDGALAGLEQSQESKRSKGHDHRLAGAETQAVLDEYASARATALHGSPTKVARMGDPPAASISYLDDRSQRTPQTRSPRIRSLLRPASELIHARQSLPPQAGEISPRRSGATRMSIPLRLEFDFRGVTTEGIEARYGTPSPSRNRSLLRDEIVSSASKRRRALDKAARKGRHSSPDTVYVSTSIPAARFTPDPPIHSPHSPRSPRARSPSPILSPAQRSDRILAGQQLVLAVREQYRARISGLSETYRVRPTELFRIVNEMPKSRGGAGSQVYWLDVEEGLRRHYGY